MELFKYVIEHWQTISIILGITGVTGFSGYQGAKVIQKKLDQSQWKSINQNDKDIKQLNTDMTALKTAIEKNTEDDKDFRESIQKIVSDTNNTVKEIQKELKDDDKETIKRLRDQLNKRK